MNNRANLNNRLMTIGEIVALLHAQAKLRAPENDAAGILAQHADAIAHEITELEKGG